jgi:flagellar FliL protein
MAEDLEDDSAEAPADGEAPPPRNRRRLLIFIGAPILVIVLALAGAYFSGLLNSLFKSSKPAETAAQAPAPVGEKPGAPGVPGQGAVFYDLPEILVNLNSQAPGRKQNFLKIRVSLELQSPLDVPKVEAVIPRIIDNFQVYLRELRVDDLQGSSGMLRLREELTTRVNQAIKPAKVSDVLFKEILVQ